MRPIQRLLRAALGAAIGADGRIRRVPDFRRVRQIIGFSHDEQRRVQWLHDDAPLHVEYATPLIDMGLTRQGCQHLLAWHGRPKVVKSACDVFPVEFRAVAVQGRRRPRQRSMGQAQRLGSSALSRVNSWSARAMVAVSMLAAN
ncbi:hypothetical protein [Spongiactinospora gelatinilytica]|uniref:hypothetical protein n=1 Tax=Spongiactinospora gelatinilytica TaxID=2666298 RepID=UPI0011B9454B|nr:hypothetical protein [Spongiactinospora gelatinilytica]